MANPYAACKVSPVAAAANMWRGMEPTAALQLDDPWVLEGWQEGPPVPEAAIKASSSLSGYVAASPLAAESRGLATTASRAKAVASGAGANSSRAGVGRSKASGMPQPVRKPSNSSGGKGPASSSGRRGRRAVPRVRSRVCAAINHLEVGAESEGEDSGNTHYRPLWGFGLPEDAAAAADAARQQALYHPGGCLGDAMQQPAGDPTPTAGLGPAGDQSMDVEALQLPAQHDQPAEQEEQQQEEDEEQQQQQQQEEEEPLPGPPPPEPEESSASLTNAATATSSSGRDPTRRSFTRLTLSRAHHSSRSRSPQPLSPGQAMVAAAARAQAALSKGLYASGNGPLPAALLSPIQHAAGVLPAFLPTAALRMSGSPSPASSPVIPPAISAAASPLAAPPGGFAAAALAAPAAAAAAEGSAGACTAPGSSSSCTQRSSCGDSSMAPPVATSTSTDNGCSSCRTGGHHAGPPAPATAATRPSGAHSEAGAHFAEAGSHFAAAGSHLAQDPAPAVAASAALSCCSHQDSLWRVPPPSSSSNSNTAGEPPHAANSAATRCSSGATLDGGSQLVGCGTPVGSASAIAAAAAAAAATVAADQEADSATRPPSSSSSGGQPWSNATVTAESEASSSRGSSAGCSGISSRSGSSSRCLVPSSSGCSVPTSKLPSSSKPSSSSSSMVVPGLTLGGPSCRTMSSAGGGYMYRTSTASSSKEPSCLFVAGSAAGMNRSANSSIHSSPRNNRPGRHSAHSTVGSSSCGDGGIAAGPMQPTSSSRSRRYSAIAGVPSAAAAELLQLAPLDPQTNSSSSQQLQQQQQPGSQVISGRCSSSDDAPAPPAAQAAALRARLAAQRRVPPVIPVPATFNSSSSSIESSRWKLRTASSMNLSCSLLQQQQQLQQPPGACLNVGVTAGSDQLLDQPSMTAPTHSVATSAVGALISGANAGRYRPIFSTPLAAPAAAAASAAATALAAQVPPTLKSTRRQSTLDVMLQQKDASKGTTLWVPPLPTSKAGSTAGDAVRVYSRTGALPGVAPEEASALAAAILPTAAAGAGETGVAAAPGLLGSRGAAGGPAAAMFGARTLQRSPLLAPMPAVDQLLRWPQSSSSGGGGVGSSSSSPFIPLRSSSGGGVTAAAATAAAGGAGPSLASAGNPVGALDLQLDVQKGALPRGTSAKGRSRPASTTGRGGAPISARSHALLLMKDVVRQSGTQL